MYAGKYCPFYQLKNIVCTTHYESLPLKSNLCSVSIRLNSELLHKAAKSPQSQSSQKPRSPSSAPDPPHTHTLTLMPFSTKMVEILPITMDLYINSCVTAHVIYQMVVRVFLTPWLLWRRRQTEKHVCPVDVEE